MSKRSQIQEHLQKLKEIGEIMRAMKNVSLMEVHKLGRFLEHQQRVLSGVEAATRDFVRHCTGALRRWEATTPTHIVALGSERGFCGDFNDVVADALLRFPNKDSAHILVVGSRLATRLEGQVDGISMFEGANTVEEVQTVIDVVMQRLAIPAADTATDSPHLVAAICHQEGREGVIAQRVSALPADDPQEPREPYPPVLNVAVPSLHFQLVRHYLWVQMHQLFYSSLLAEHRFRLQHMERALQRMEEKTAALSRQQNILRQEEITEEIEVIMLNSDVKRARRRPEGSQPWQ
ncbi:F0F1 ATP synthase subunit gamma [Noviherbaspirillum agri]